MCILAFEKSKTPYELLDYINITEDIYIDLIKKYGQVVLNNVFRRMITDNIIKYTIEICGDKTEAIYEVIADIDKPTIYMRYVYFKRYPKRILDENPDDENM